MRKSKWRYCLYTKNSRVDIVSTRHKFNLIVFFFFTNNLNGADRKDPHQRIISFILRT